MWRAQTPKARGAIHAQLLKSHMAVQECFLEIAKAAGRLINTSSQPAQGEEEHGSDTEEEHTDPVQNNITTKHKYYIIVCIRFVIQPLHKADVGEC